MLTTARQTGPLDTLLSGSLLKKAHIHPCGPHELDIYWPLVQNYIQDALEHSDYEISLDDIQSDIANQMRQLWIIKKDDLCLAAIVTRVFKTLDDRTIGRIEFAGGSKHKLWDHFVDFVSHWFLEQGCQFIDIAGRKGWRKLYEKRGFKECLVILRKELK